MVGEVREVEIFSYYLVAQKLVHFWNLIKFHVKEHPLSSKFWRNPAGTLLKIITYSSKSFWNLSTVQKVHRSQIAEHMNNNFIW